MVHWVDSGATQEVIWGLPKPSLGSVWQIVSFKGRVFPSTPLELLSTLSLSLGISVS